MSSDTDVLRICTGIAIKSDLLEAAMDECDRLDLNTTAPFKAFQPPQTCVAIIESVNKQSPRKVQTRSVIVLLPGATTDYLQSPCIVIPIKNDCLPNTVTTKGGKVVTVDWEEGKAWEILEDVRLAAVTKKGGTLLVLRH